MQLGERFVLGVKAKSSGRAALVQLLNETHADV